MKRLAIPGVILALALLPACIPSSSSHGPNQTRGPVQMTKAFGPKTAPELVKEWKSIAESNKPNYARAEQIGRELSKLGSKNLYPLLDVLADPKEKPSAKAVVLGTLRPLVRPDMAFRLKPLCLPGHDFTTRACAIELLSKIPSPDIVPFLKSFQNDPEKRVRIAAVIGLLNNGDPGARKALSKLYHQPDRTTAEKVALISAVADNAQPQDTAILTEALADNSLPEETKTDLVIALGRVGEPSAVEPLKKYAATTVPQGLRKLATDASEAIETRARQKKGKASG